MTAQPSANDQPPIRITTPNELVSLIPYLIGHHPADSLVLLGCDATKVIVTVRLGLGDPTNAWAQIVPNLARSGVITGHLVGYGSAARVGPHIDTAHAALTLNDIASSAPVRVEHGRIYATGTGAGPGDLASSHADEGVRVDPHTAAAARAVVEGMVALPSRDAIHTLVAPTGPAEQAAMRSAVARARSAGAPVTGEAAVQAADAAVTDALGSYRTGDRLTDDDVARLTLLLTDEQARDAVLARDEDDDASIALWTDVTRRADASLVAEPACILFVAAWLARRAPLAWAALDRARDAEPGHRLTRLLSAMVWNGISPDQLAEVLRRRRSDASHP
ncbi:DUF4192 domain-containing protein [Cryptosporangium sp. NPDC048952]|uniref:DUF4192 domain-containing protein n=1 Tax=Cryptosporangium sp. NPDC048952 TaxID=3363961 RepID=UPI0037238630